MKQRVLIISASAGTGHVRCGQALEKAFRADPRTGEVVHLDALNYTSKLFRDFYSTLYEKVIRDAPQLFGWAYRASDEPWKNERVRTKLEQVNTHRLVKVIRQFDPHVTVCTHFLPVGIISHLISKRVIDPHLSIVVTDLDCHAMWLARVFDRYFVALDETKAHLEALGMPGAQITVSGIPIDPVFSAPIDRTAARASHGLHPEKLTLLLSAGALGIGPTEVIVERLLEVRHDIQAMVICGKSAELRERMERLVGAESTRFRILGFSDRMHELMRMSDLFIGKPGGLTTAEVLACGLPMVITSPIPGQEERNSDHLLEKGVAIKCNELMTLPFKIERLLDDPAKLQSMRASALALGRPAAAANVVNTLLDERSDGSVD